MSHSSNSATCKTTLPKISIVTPSFNQGSYIKQTICSVLDQNYPNLEYVVIDGGSSDHSVEVIQQYAHHFSYWHSQPDQGQADAINQGFAHCSGEIMGWLNSDDLLLPNALHTVSQYFTEHPEANIVCGFRRFAIGQQVTHGRFVHLPPNRFTLQRRCYIAQETTFWRRDVWESVGPLDSSFHFALDYDLWQRMLAKGYRFDLLPRYLGLFRLHDRSKTIHQHQVRTKELARIYRHYLDTTKNEQELYEEISDLWKQRMLLAYYAAHSRLLSSPRLAAQVLRLLNIAEKQCQR